MASGTPRAPRCNTPSPHDFDRSIFATPLEERRRRLLAMDWVEDASISRIWPDRLVVRIHERTPVAFVYFRAGVLLIDANGVLLEPPAQEGGLGHFSFPVLSGVREDESEADREQRVRAMLRVQEDLGYMAKDVSEVNAADLENLRVIAQGGGPRRRVDPRRHQFGQSLSEFSYSLSGDQETIARGENIRFAAG